MDKTIGKISHEIVLIDKPEVLEQVPRGKTVYIGPEEMEVWPEHCVDGHRCIQCMFVGKTGCAPRFWMPLMRWRAEHPEMPQAETKPVLYSLYEVFPLDKERASGGALADYFAAQPLEPFNDGGFVEEITDRLNIRLRQQLCKTLEPLRITDEACKWCGYQGTRFWGKRRRCPRCKRTWMPPGGLTISEGVRKHYQALPRCKLCNAYLVHRKRRAKRICTKCLRMLADTPNLKAPSQSKERVLAWGENEKSKTMEMLKATSPEFEDHGQLLDRLSKLEEILTKANVRASPADLAAMKKEGKSLREIAKLAGVNRSTISWLLKEEKGGQGGAGAA